MEAFTLVDGVTCKCGRRMPEGSTAIGRRLRAGADPHRVEGPAVIPGAPAAALALYDTPPRADGASMAWVFVCPVCALRELGHAVTEHAPTEAEAAQFAAAQVESALNRVNRRFAKADGDLTTIRVALAQVADLQTTIVETLRSVVGSPWRPREERRAGKTHLSALLAGLVTREYPGGPPETLVDVDGHKLGTLGEYPGYYPDQMDELRGLERDAVGSAVRAPGHAPRTALQLIDAVVAHLTAARLFHVAGQGSAWTLDQVVAHFAPSERVVVLVPDSLVGGIAAGYYEYGAGVWSHCADVIRGDRTVLVLRGFQ